MAIIDKNLAIGLNNSTNKLTIIDDRNLSTISVTNSYSNMTNYNDISYSGIIKNIGNSQNGINIGLLVSTRFNWHNNIALMALNNIDDTNLYIYQSFFNSNNNIGISIYSQMAVNNINYSIGYKHIDLQTGINYKKGIELLLHAHNNINVSGINIYINSHANANNRETNSIFGNYIYINAYSKIINGSSIVINNDTSITDSFIKGLNISLNTIFTNSSQNAKYFASGISIEMNNRSDNYSIYHKIYGININSNLLNGVNMHEVIGVNVNFNCKGKYIYGVRSQLIKTTNENIDNYIYALFAKSKYKNSLINYGGYFDAEDASIDNYALVTENGKVGFGTVTPVKKFEIALDEVRIGVLTNVPQPGYVLGAINTSGDVDWLNPATLPGLPKKYVERNVSLTANIPYIINHNLNATDIMIEIFALNTSTNNWYITNEFEISNQTSTSITIIPTIDMTVNIIIIG